MDRLATLSARVCPHFFMFSVLAELMVNDSDMLSGLTVSDVMEIAE